MARYRKIDPRIWNDRKFRSMTDAGKLVFLFVLTHPHMTSIGAMRATLGGLADELGWELKAFREAFGEAFAKGMVKHDPKASFLALPNFLKYNAPESPNVVKAWVSASDLLPECDLKEEVIQWVKAFVEGLPEAFAKALPKDFAKGMPNQEQEQEQEQEQYLNQKQEQTSLVANEKKLNTSRFEQFWNAYPLKQGKKVAKATWDRRKLDRIADQIIADVVERKRSDQKWRDGFIPMASTYVNQERWQDEIAPTKPLIQQPSKTRQGIENLMRGVNGHESNRTGNTAGIEQTGLLELGSYTGDGHARRNR